MSRGPMFMDGKNAWQVSVSLIRWFRRWREFWDIINHSIAGPHSRWPQ